MVGAMSFCSIFAVDLVALVEGRPKEAEQYSTDPLVIGQPEKDWGFLGRVSL